MSSPALRRAIFIDRDGTLIEEKDYLHKPEELKKLNELTKGTN